MPVIQTRHLGAIEFDETAVLDFPDGLPAFESERRFLLVNDPQIAPVLVLQSLDSPELGFPTLPVDVVVPDYEPAVSREDLAALALAVDRQPRLGDDVLCLGILTLREEGGATINLLSPVLINPNTRVGRQVVQVESDYSYAHQIGGLLGTGADAC